MLKKLHILLIFSTLVVSNPLGGIIIYMRNFVTKFGKILEICKKFAGNLETRRELKDMSKTILNIKLITRVKHSW